MTVNKTRVPSLGIENDIWVKVNRAAARHQLKTGERISISEWIRRAINEKLERDIYVPGNPEETDEDG